MTQNYDLFQVGDTFLVSTWGRLTGQGIAQHGVAVLAGMVSAYHANCPEPHHFWCAPPQLRVFAMANLYQADGAAGENYIGCYFSGADCDDDGAPTVHRMPSLKALIQPMDDGRVFVQFGRITAQGSSSSAGGLGMLERRTSEYFVVTPRPVPDIPSDIGDSATFVFQRFNNTWHIAYFPHGDELPTSAQVRVFAAMPVLPEPSPLSKIVISNDPLRQ